MCIVVEMTLKINIAAGSRSRLRQSLHPARYSEFFSSVYIADQSPQPAIFSSEILSKI